jgi:hypothetical protein
MACTHIQRYNQVGITLGVAYSVYAVYDSCSIHSQKYWKMIYVLLRNLHSI